MKLEFSIGKSREIPKSLTRYAMATLQVLLGSIFLALMARIAMPIPFAPIPVSMQTLGVALLAITLGPRKGALAVATYLMQASLGLPVLIGGSVNPLWMIGPTAGYLAGFAVSVFVLGTVLEKQKNTSFIKSWLLLSLNEGIILLMGSMWLASFVGWDKAFMLGIVPYIPGGLIKITIAASFLKSVPWYKTKR